MAAGRHPKDNLDYFPLYCNMGDKVKYLEARCGLIGFAILIKLLQKIYGERGYYCEFNEKKAFLLADELKTGERKIIQTVEVSVSEGIFEEEMYRKYGILTSARIQENFLDATSRRVDAKILPEYALVNCAQISNNVDNNGISVSRNEDFDSRNEQKKEEVKFKDKFLSFSSHNARLRELLDDGALILSEEEKGKLKNELSDDDIIHYCEVIIDSEKRGHRYTKRSHFSAIMDMAKKDGKAAGRKQKSKEREIPKYGNFNIDEVFEAALARSYAEDAAFESK